MIIDTSYNLVKKMKMFLSKRRNLQHNEVGNDLENIV